MSEIDLVVTDLDGTLWDHNIEVHPDSRAALDTLVEEGVPVLAATGRRKVSTLRGFEKSGLTFPAVTVNGAFGFLPGTAKAAEREFHRAPFSVDLGLRVVEIYRSMGHVPVAYNIDGTAYVSKDTTTSEHHIETFTDDAVRKAPEEAARLGEVVGFSIMGADTDEDLNKLGVELRDLGVVTDPYREPIYGGWAMSVQPPGVSKWLGVTRYCDFVGLAQPRVLALGDGGNDIELLEGADIALGVKGGDPEALATADRLVQPPQEGGWATVLEYL